MGYYYLQFEDETPMVLKEQNWCFEVVQTVPNRFEHEKDAIRWCSRLNHNFMSRMPWHIRNSEDHTYDKYVF